jgi:hypothetical protein
MAESPDLSSAFQRLGGIEPAVGTEFYPLNERAIRAIEAKVGGSLPTAYRQFLATYGASLFCETVFFRPNEPFPHKYSKNNRGTISTLLGQQHPKFPKAKHIDILHTINVLQESFPEGLIPIGDDGGGDKICMRIGEKPYGAIVLWDHENRGQSGDGFYPVSVSFDEWIHSMTVD